MRRPLFDTGRPKLLQGGAAEDVVLSLSGLSENLQQRVVGLTLFAITSPGAGSAVTILAKDLDSGKSTGLYQRALGNAANTQVVQLLDRYPMRGNVQVSAGSAATQANQEVFLFGYYQIDGERTVPVEFRPLQPDPNNVDKNYIATTVTNGEVAKLHAFTDTYIDVVKLFGNGSSVATPTLVIADGIGLSSIKIDRIGNASTLLFPLFDRIPFRAASMEAVGGYSPGIHMSCPDAADLARLWGVFTRS